MKENIIKNKSFLFAVRIVKLNQYLIYDKKDFVISKQILRSGTSIGAIIRESEHAESKADFIHKMALAQKEANETLYWLDLLFHTEFLNKEQYDSIYNDCNEIYSIITKIIKTIKKNTLTTK